MRLLEGALLASLFVAAIFFAYNRPYGIWLFSTLLITFATGACWEFCALLQKKQITPYTPFLLVGGGVYLLLHIITFLYAIPCPLPLLWILILLGTLGYKALKSTEDTLSSMAYTILGFVYIYLPTQLLLDLTYTSPAPGIPITRWWLIWTLVIIKGSDIAAYFVGKSFGRLPLTALSPKKTWEGFHAGWLGGALCSCLMGLAAGAPSIPWCRLLLLGAGLSICAMVGDLVESRFKREIGVKDSNSLIPGLGGFLDMADSLLYATPFAYFCFRYFGA